MRFHTLAVVMLTALVAIAPFGPAALAGNDDPLFVNLTTDDSHRATMALAFASKQQSRKHPVSIFLNDRAVVLAAKSNAGKYASQQNVISEIHKAGGIVLICPMCMKHYGVAADDLIAGVTLSNPELVGEQLFKEDARTLTW